MMKICALQLFGHKALPIFPVIRGGPCERVSDRGVLKKELTDRKIPVSLYRDRGSRGASKEGSGLPPGEGSHPLKTGLFHMKLYIIHKNTLPDPGKATKIQPAVAAENTWTGGKRPVL